MKCNEVWRCGAARLGMASPGAAVMACWLALVSHFTAGATRVLKVIAVAARTSQVFTGSHEIFITTLVVLSGPDEAYRRVHSTHNTKEHVTSRIKAFTNASGRAHVLYRLIFIPAA